jgi:hypothetical protein
MSLDINEARAIVEAAKKRGAIREAGSILSPVSATAESKEEPKVVLPEWLREGASAPASGEKPSSPEWR